MVFEYKFNNLLSDAKHIRQTDCVSKSSPSMLFILLGNSLHKKLTKLMKILIEY